MHKWLTLMKPAIRSTFVLFLLTLLSLQIQSAKANISVEIQPGTQTVAVGQHVVLGAIAVTTAGETILGYQWYMSPSSGGPFTQIAQGGSLVFNSIQPTNSGYYLAKVIYQTGGNQSTVSSPTIQLTVDVHVHIVTQPVGVTSEPGSNATFSVTAAGSPPLTFQWRHNGVNLANDLRTTGADTANLTIQNLLFSDVGNYDVIVGNAYGTSNSQPAVCTGLGM